MGSAHCLIEVKSQAKFGENPSISIGFRADTIFGDQLTEQPTDTTKRIQYSHPFCGGGVISNLKKTTLKSLDPFPRLNLSIKPKMLKTKDYLSLFKLGKENIFFH
jgi:hypothetical protein